MQSQLWPVLALALGMVTGIPRSASAASFKVIHAFDSATDGVIPEGRLIFDKAGNLYGTTVGGGPNGGGMVFELSPDGNGNWNETILYSFTGGSDGEEPVAGVVMDTDGNLYGTTQQGAIRNSNCSTGCGVVYELSPSSNGWSYQVLYSFTGVPDGAFPNGELVIDAAGNLYGVTGGGGTSQGCFEGCGTVFELVKANGWQEQTLHVFNFSSLDGQLPSGKLLMDGQGNLYGTTQIGGSGYGTAYEVTQSNGTWSERVIYNFCFQINCKDGNQPSAGVIDIDGQLFGTAAMGGGGTGYYGTVFKLKKFGTNWFAKSYPFNIVDGADPVAPVLYHEGVLYGVTAQGGIQNGACVLYPSGNGVVFKLALVNGSVKETVLYEFTGGNDGCGPVGGLVADATGNLYGTTNQGGGSENGGTIFEVTP